MAKIFYELKKNMNEESAAFGKYYAHIKAIETLDTRKLAQHIAEHGSVFTSDVVLGVMEKFRNCLLEMLLESKKVKIDGLGIFYCTIENAQGGAESPEKFNIQKNLTALHIRFLPEQEQEMNISSREFLKRAEFINIATLLKSSDTDETGEDPENTEDNGHTDSTDNTDNQGGATGGSTGGNDGGGDGGESGDAE